MKGLRVALWRCAVLAGAMLVTVACDKGDATPAPPAATVDAATATATAAAPTPEPTATTPPEPSPTSAPTATPAPAPRAASYADLTYTVTEVVVSNETWLSYGNPSQHQEGSDSFLYVHLSVTNALTHVPLLFESDLFFIEIGDKQTEALRLWSQAANKIVNPGSTVRYITGFPVPSGFAAAGAQLVIAEPGRAPASVVLEGPPDPPAYPIAAEVLDEASPVSAGFRCDSLTVDPRVAEIDLDAGVDATGIAGTVQGGRRALPGERFLRFEVNAKAGASNCGLQSGFFRLQFGGQTLEPVNRINTSVNAGNSLDFQVVFRVPVGAGDIVLLVGSPGGNVKPFPIAVPSFGP